MSAILKVGNQTLIDRGNTMLIHFFWTVYPTYPVLKTITSLYTTLYRSLSKMSVLVAAQFYYTDLRKWFMSSDYTHLPSLHTLSTKCWLLICT